MPAPIDTALPNAWRVIAAGDREGFTVALRLRVVRRGRHLNARAEGQPAVERRREAGVIGEAVVRLTTVVPRHANPTVAIHRHGRHEVIGAAAFARDDERVVIDEAWRRPCRVYSQPTSSQVLRLEPSRRLAESGWAGLRRILVDWNLKSWNWL